MARSCGIHIDQRRFHLVSLDGSPRKHRVVAQASGEIPFDADPVEAVSDALRQIAKQKKLHAESVGLAVDSGLAAFRALTVPFDDRSKIEDVIKFEIESDLPQWDIDDVIVDFLVLSTKPGVESNLLVTAIPKPRLAAPLRACERGGFEAGEAELDGTALFEAALVAGALSEEEAQLLVHVGDSSTTVVVVDGGRLVSMRAIRAGAYRYVEPVDDEDAEGTDADLDAESSRVRARLAETAKRIRRELGRTVMGSATENPLAAIYFCGHRLEGLIDEGELFDVPVHPLEAVPLDEDSDEDAAELTIAYGAALRALGGGVLSPSLRREELHFSGKFERIELPLAVFSLLLCTLLVVKLIVTQKQIDWRDEGTAGAPGDMQYWLQYSNMYLLPDPEQLYKGRLTNPPDELLSYLKKAEAGQDDVRTKYEELLLIKKRLNDSVTRLQKDLGHVSDIPQPQSALQAATLVIGVLDELGARVGRFSIRSLSADYQKGRAASGDDDRVEVRMDMDFFADDTVAAAEHYTALMGALNKEPWCTEFEERPSKPFGDGAGLSYERLKIEVDVAAAMREAENEKSSTGEVER